MKRHLLLFWLLLFGALVSVNAQTVYITNTGEKYHSAGCQYLSHSKIAIELPAAIEQGYTACKVCKPVQPVNAISKKEASEDPAPAVSKYPKSVQCIATTQKGTRCRRTTTSANGKCWQHGGQ